MFADFCLLPNCIVVKVPPTEAPREEQIKHTKWKDHKKPVASSEVQIEILIVNPGIQQSLGEPPMTLQLLSTMEYDQEWAISTQDARMLSCPGFDRSW